MQMEMELVDGFSDVNKDGADDFLFGNPLANPDSDRDGLADALDLDSDNDGIFDVIEAGGIDPDLDGIIGTGPIADADMDGFSDIADTDDNTTPALGDGPGTQLPVPNTDGGPQANYQDTDSDGDGCSDVIEAGFTDDNSDGLLGDAPLTINEDGTVSSGTDGYTAPGTEYTDDMVSASECNPPAQGNEAVSIDEDTMLEDFSITANNTDPDGDATHGYFPVRTHRNCGWRHLQIMAMVQ